MTARLSWKPIGRCESATVVGLGLLLGIGTQITATGSPPGSVLGIAQTKLLSKHGSTRATRYAGTNKIVTIDDKTHIAWLDSVANTMIASYDHDSGRWGRPVKVGSGTDNHGGPALTCDSRGYLHIVFGPHGDVPFQHFRSAKRNDSTAWVKLDDFGHYPTYPSAVCDDQDSLHVIYRGSLTSGYPCKLIYQRRTKDGIWSEPMILVKPAADWKGYTHYHPSIAIDGKQTLHVAFILYEGGISNNAGYMMSRDRGKTWALADGFPLNIPVSVGSDALFTHTEKTFTLGNVVCDSEGHPWVSMDDRRSKAGPTIFRHDGKTWSSLCPAKLTTRELPLSRLSCKGSLTIDSQDRVYVVLTRGSHITGGTRGDIILLCSVDRGKSFRYLEVFPPDEQLPHTGLSLERPTGHNVIETPWLLFSTGRKGPDCFGKGIFHKVQAVQLHSLPTDSQ